MSPSGARFQLDDYNYKHCLPTRLKCESFESDLGLSDFS